MSPRDLHSGPVIRPRTRRLAAFGLASVLAVSISGCSREARGSAAPTSTCFAVSDDVLRQIAVGAQPGTPLSLAAGSAVRARKGVFVVAARISDAKGSPVGVWTVTALHGRIAPILVADVTASAHSTWVSVDEFPQYGVPLDSPTITAARQCLAG
jgi:hypothetical protein